MAAAGGELARESTIRLAGMDQADVLVDGETISAVGRGLAGLARVDKAEARLESKCSPKASARTC